MTPIATSSCATRSPAVEGVELVDEDYDEDVVDVVLMWWRDGDGDLVDALVDALTPLADGAHLAADAQGGPPGPRRAERHRRGRAHGRARPDVERERGPGLVGFAAGRAEGAAMRS